MLFVQTDARAKGARFAAVVYQRLSQELGTTVFPLLPSRSSCYVLPVLGVQVRTQLCRYEKARSFPLWLEQVRVYIAFHASPAARNSTTLKKIYVTGSFSFTLLLLHHLPRPLAFHASPASRNSIILIFFLHYWFIQLHAPPTPSPPPPPPAPPHPHQLSTLTSLDVANIVSRRTC